MKYNRLAFLIGLVFLVSITVCTANWPLAKGTFIQDWLVKDWSSEMLAKELNYLKEAGIEFLLFAPTAYGHNDGHYLSTLYPTKIPNWKEYYPGNDVLEKLLIALKKADMKIILGLNMNDLWWEKGIKDPEWLYSEISLGNTLAQEIYELYYPKYKDTIIGWYFVWEIDNLMVRGKGKADIISHAFNIQLDFLTKLDPNLFLVWSPYMNPQLATKEEYRDFWIEVFAKTHFRSGDVFAPMDCVGGGGTTIDTFPAWFAEFRKAVDTKPGLLFWSNAENFVHTDWTSATINRFVEQLKRAAPYVDNFITFAYPHYYSPNIIDSGFHTTYLEYVQTGDYEKIPPTPPKDLSMVIISLDELFLRWDPGSDNIGVAGYIIYRDGKQIGKTQVLKQGDRGLFVNAFKESKLRIGKTYKYSVCSYDFAGNISDFSEVLEYTHE